MTTISENLQRYLEICDAKYRARERGTVLADDAFSGHECNASEARAELKALLVEALESPAIPVTPEFWAEKRAELIRRHPELENEPDDFFLCPEGEEMRGAGHEEQGLG